MAFTPRTWADGELVPAADMNRIEQGIASAAATGGGGGGGGAVASVNGQIGNVTLNASNVGAAPTSHTHIVDNVTGLQALLDAKLETDVDGRIQPSNLPRGFSFEVRWTSGTWKYQNVTITARPLGLTHLYMISRGNQTAPPFQIVGDIWFPEVP